LQFYGSLKAEDNENIKIVDAFYGTFKDFIHFIYNEGPFEKFKKIENCEKLRNVLELYYLGEKYQIDVLKGYLHFVICNNISINSTNVFQFLQDIEESSPQFQKLYAIVKEICFDFLDSNIKVFMNTKDVANIDDTNFLDINTMYQLLRRKSLKTTEYTVYKIAKAYLVSTTENNGNLDLKNVPKFLKDTVDFQKMNLREIKSLLNDTWLPQDFKWIFAKAAIERNSEQLKPSIPRTLSNTIPLQVESPIAIDDIVSFKMNSSKNVLLQITAPRHPNSSNFPKLEINQEGVKETIEFVFGKYFAYIQKDKSAHIRVVSPNSNLKTLGIVSQNQDQSSGKRALDVSGKLVNTPSGKISSIKTETKIITFSDVKVNSRPGQSVFGSYEDIPFDYCVCEVPDAHDPNSLNGHNENQSGFKFQISPANIANFDFGGSTLNKEKFSFGGTKPSL